MMEYYSIPRTLRVNRLTCTMNVFCYCCCWSLIYGFYFLLFFWVCSRFKVAATARLRIRVASNKVSLGVSEEVQPVDAGLQMTVRF